MNLNEALKRAQELGCKVSNLFRTGEVRIELPGRRRKLRLNGRRKDCPAILETVIRQIEKGSLREDVLVDRTEHPVQEEQPAKERKRFRPPPAIQEPRPSGTLFIPEPAIPEPAETLLQPAQQPIEPQPIKQAEPIELPAEIEDELEEIEPEPTEEELAEIRRRLRMAEDLEDTLYYKAFRIFKIMTSPRKPGPPMKVGLTTEEIEANQARKRAERAERKQEKIRKAAEKRKRREERRAQAADLPDQGT